MLARAALLAVSLLLAAAGPAGAVVGGTAVAPASAPWFVGTGLCGGTLIAPDRVVTAAHCVDPVDLAELDRIVVGDQVRRATRVALPPTWARQRVGFALHDIAIVALDAPVTTVRPAALPEPGAALPRTVRVLGRGQTKAPAPGEPVQSGLYPLRQATLRTVPDAACERRWRRSGTKYRGRFDAPSMICAIDAGGRAPHASVCQGDSGGPLIAGTPARPVLLGVISWTGPRCGADRLPSVAAEIERFRAFVTDPAPAWAPVPGGPSRITGEPRAGATLTCETPPWIVAPARLEHRWLRRVRTKTAYEFRTVGRAPTYTATAADRGALLECQVLGAGPGGRAQTPPGAGIRVAG